MVFPESVDVNCSDGFHVIRRTGVSDISFLWALEIHPLVHIEFVKE
jgi:hypothetical protein